MDKNPNPIKDQFFLKDKKVLDDIIATIDMQPGETIVEIGGGEGALTDYLVKTSKGQNFITVIEKDPYYANYLKKRYADHKNVEVIEGDALKFDLADYDRVVANLPYTITEPFLINLAASGAFAGTEKSKRQSRVKSTTLLLSQNSVRKMVAPVQVVDGGSKHFCSEFGMMGAICKAFLDVEVVRAVASEAFFPEPAVTSILVNLTPKQKLTTVDRILQAFFVDTKGAGASIKKVYSMILAQSKVYNVNKYKNNQASISTSFTSKNIEDKNIYELNNSQLSTLFQDLIRNDMNTKSKQNQKQSRIERMDYRNFKTYEDYLDYEDMLEEQERNQMKTRKAQNAMSKYEYMYDSTVYDALSHRGLEYISQEEFNALVSGQDYEDEIESSYIISE